MIFTPFIVGVMAVVRSLLMALPDVGTQSAFSVSVATASGYLSPMNSIAPIGTILAGLFFLVFFEGAYFIYKGIMWVLKRLPTQS